MPSDVRKVRSLLAFLLPGIGDTLLALPAIRSLKQAVPDCRVTAVAMFGSVAELLGRVPFLDEVLYFDFPREGVIKSMRFLRAMHRRRFDASFLSYPANRAEYNLVNLLAGARLRLGHRYNHLDWRCLNWLNNRRVREDDSRTNVMENLRLMEILTGCRLEPDVSPVISLQNEERQNATAWLQHRGLSNRILIGFHPGGSTFKNHIHKRWPAARYVSLGRSLLAARKDVAIILFGGDGENSLVTEILGSLGDNAFAVLDCGILDAAAIIEQCRHFVANDTGLMHLAGALRIPSTGIFGPTHADWVRMPGARRSEVSQSLPCQPCFYYSPRPLRCRFGDFRCLANLTTAQVAASVLQAIDREDLPGSTGNGV